MPDALIIDAVRSPIGKRDGALSKIRGDELAAQILNGLVERNLDRAHSAHDPRLQNRHIMGVH